MSSTFTSPSPSASQAGLVTVTQVAALQVYVDPAQLGVVRVVIVTSLAPVFSTRCRGQVRGVADASSLGFHARKEYVNMGAYLSVSVHGQWKPPILNAIKKQHKGTKRPPCRGHFTCIDLVLYGIRELASVTPGSLSWTSSGGHCLTPVIAVRLGVWLGVDWELEQLEPGGRHCLHTEEDQDYKHQADCGAHLTDTTRLSSPYLSVQSTSYQLPDIRLA